MCKRALMRVWKTADTVQELKDLIGDDIVINDSYKGQTIKPDQCLCCVDMEATAKLHSFDHEIIDGDFWFKTWAIDRMSVKFHFPGPVQEVQPRKIDPEIIDINDHNEIVSALVEALEKAVNDYGKPGGPWNVSDEPGAWLAMAKAALKKARGEMQENG